MLPYQSRLDRRNRLLEANGSELAAFRSGNMGHIGLTTADLQHSLGPDRNLDQEIKGSSKAPTPSTYLLGLLTLRWPPQQSTGSLLDGDNGNPPPPRPAGILAADLASTTFRRLMPLANAQGGPPPPILAAAPPLLQTHAAAAAAVSSPPCIDSTDARTSREAGSMLDMFQDQAPALVLEYCGGPVVQFQGCLFVAPKKALTLRSPIRVFALRHLDQQSSASNALTDADLLSRFLSRARLFRLLYALRWLDRGLEVSAQSLAPHPIRAREAKDDSQVPEQVLHIMDVHTVSRVLASRGLSHWISPAQVGAPSECLFVLQSEQ
ncbi:hypothetical protein ABBQ38_012987 [Trebouxia sp. C0009 RCD-2024]